MHFFAAAAREEPVSPWPRKVQSTLKDLLPRITTEVSMFHQFRSVLTAVLVVAALAAPRISASADESAILRGKVVDFEGKAIKKVSVVLTSADDPANRLVAKTDGNGLFEIAVKDASLSYTARFERGSYVSMSAAVVLSPVEANKYTFTMLTQQEIDEGKEDILREREKPAGFAARALFNDGVEAFTAGDITTARSRFEAAVVEDDSMLPALSALSLVTMQQQDWKDAIEYATRTLAIEPTDLRALLALYRANRELGNDAAAAAAAEALKSAGTNDEVAGQVFNEAVDFYRENDVNRALALFEEASELDPTLVEAQIALAGLYLNKGAFDDSLAASERALALLPGDKRALKYRFEACLRSGNDQLPEAIEGLAAVDLPYVTKAVNETALNLFEANEFEQSKRLVEQLLELDPEDARANYVMGLLLVNAGDNNAARKYLQAFVDAAPEDPDAAGARTMMEAIQ
jgi:tetratricopeptide (TPR) repeat protein